MPKIVSIKPEKNPEAEEAHKLIIQFAEEAKGIEATSVILVAISPTQQIATQIYVSPNEHLRVLGLLRLIQAEYENDLIEVLSE